MRKVIFFLHCVCVRVSVREKGGVFTRVLVYNRGESICFIGLYLHNTKSYSLIVQNVACFFKVYFYELLLCVRERA